MTTSTIKKTENLLKLGILLSQFADILSKEISENDPENNPIEKMAQETYLRNQWFTRDQIALAFKAWSLALEKNKITEWLSNYKFNQKTELKVGLIMAGNIPLVGLHDLLCLYVCNCRVYYKTSADDSVLPEFVLNCLKEIDPDCEPNFIKADGAVKNMDAYIATGSNNSARYFEYYFRNKPSVIRKNRHSVAILSGNESPEQLNLLGRDIFLYFGLGCRNVSKLFVPSSYKFDDFFQAIYSYSHVINHKKYGNNYDYNRAVYLMNKIDLLDNNFLLLKNDDSIGSPVAVLFYEYYQNKAELAAGLTGKQEQIQCVVSAEPFGNFAHIPFGQSQFPGLSDYADGVDLIQFILNIGNEI